MTDTAGLRDTEDIIEKEGIKRSRLQYEQSQAIIFVISFEHLKLLVTNSHETTFKITNEEIASEIRSILTSPPKQLSVLLNKLDLHPQIKSALENKEVFSISLASTDSLIISHTPVSNCAVRPTAIVCSLKSAEGIS